MRIHALEPNESGNAVAVAAGVGKYNWQSRQVSSAINIDINVIIP